MWNCATIKNIEFVDGEQVLTIVVDNSVKVLMKPSVIENNMLLPNDFVKVTCNKNSPSIVEDMVFVDKVF
jgi:hypothetical protein